MNNNYQADAVESIPELSTLTSQGYPTNGSPELGIPATQPGAAWFYAVTSELVTAIEKLGGTPSRDNVSQLADTLLAKFALKADLESPVLTGDVTVPDPVQDHNPVTKAYLVELLKRISIVPTGAVLTSAGNEVPEGFLLCNGAAISRTTYAKLFAAIGTLYGVGDSATTFNLPDMRDKFAEGSGTYTVGTVVKAGLPNITGKSGALWSTAPNGFVQEGALYTDKVNAGSLTGGGAANGVTYLQFDASRSSSIYSNSVATVQPSSLIFNYVIKY